MGPTGIEPVPTASETIVLSIGLRAQFSHGVDGDSSSNLNGLASIVFFDEKIPIAGRRISGIIGA